MKRYEQMVEQVKKWQAAGVEEGIKEYIIQKNGINTIELQAGSGTMVLILTVFMENGTIEEVVYGVGRKSIFLKNAYANPLEVAVEQVMLEELPVKPKIYITLNDHDVIQVGWDHPKVVGWTGREIIVEQRKDLTVDENVNTICHSIGFPGFLEVVYVDMRT